MYICTYTLIDICQYGCPFRYAGAEGEVYAHVCKKYGEPMLEASEVSGEGIEGIEGISEPKSEKKPRAVKVEDILYLL